MTSPVKRTPSGAPKKARWTAAQKAAAKKKPQRGQAASTTGRYAARPGRDDGPARGSRPAPPDRPARDDRPGSAAPSRAQRSRPDRDQRPRRFDRDDRPTTRRPDGADRPRRFASEDRPRRFGSDDRPRRFGSEDRPRRFERDDRPRRFDRDDRPRRFDRDDRPTTRRPDGADRPRRFASEDRPRRFGSDDRPRRFGSEDRPRRFERDDRPRRFASEDRPRRFERDDRPEHLDPEAERLQADTWTSSARRPVTDRPVAVDADNGFAALGLPAALVERLARDGLTDPFPIQAATIPDTLAGRDVLGRAQTGSGKTLAFGLPTLARLGEHRAAQQQRGERRTPKAPIALVLVPTRELAMQVSDSLEPLVHVLGLRHKLVAGGLSYTTQIAALERGVDLLVATPGRLVDLLERGAVDLGQVQVAILDEADHMAEMGFLPEVTAILDRVPEGGQRLLFSATLDHGVDRLVERYLTAPVTHSTDDATAAVETMHHFPLLVAPDDKKPLTTAFAARPGRTLAFTRTKLGADRVARQLRESGVLAAALHGGLTQTARNKVLGAFREGRLPVLVATDVAARGIHVDDIELVLQVDPPADHKDYLHRAGRTARAGEQGSVVTLVLPHQRKPMERLLQSAGLQQTPTRARPGDELAAAAGAVLATADPVTDEALRKVLDPHPVRHQPGGARGPRHARRHPADRPRPGRGVRD